MRLNLKRAFESLLNFGKSSDEDEIRPIISMVLLLREPRFLTLIQLRLAAEKAFGTSFAGGKGSKHCVVHAVLFTLVKAGPHMLSFLDYTKPYGDEDLKFGGSMPKASQRQAWANHTAWTAIDYVNGGADIELEYAVLAKLCAEMLNDNCTGVYVPAEQSFIPNDGSLRGELERIAASRDLGVR